MDYISDFIGMDEVVIYGYSEFGKKIALTLEKYNIRIVFLDNYKESEINTIYKISDFKWNENGINRKYIIAGFKSSYEMEDNLLENGVDKKDIFIPNEVLKYRLSIKENIILRRKPRKTLNLIFCITEHCNLNCAMCDHFSPLSKEWYMGIDVFEKDLLRIKEICGDKIELIKIEGGEPLLHKDIVSFIETSRTIFPNVRIELLTNGLLLEKMTDDFWNTCKRNDIIIKVTKYPLKFNYKKMKDVVENKGIQFVFANDDTIEKEMLKYAIDIEGKQNKYESFHECPMANGECMQVRNGKLYQCTKIACFRIFNEYFNEELTVDEKNYLDIYSNIMFEDIVDYLCNPVPACKYCINSYLHSYKWSISEKKIDEWV